jgi:hypothetical protein
MAGLGSQGAVLSNKVYENRLRRMAGRQRLDLRRNRRRDPLAFDYGIYELVNLSTGEPVLTTKALAEVEQFLTTPRRGPSRLGSVGN